MTAIQSTEGTFQRVLNRPAIRQFVKFCIVGAGSTVIDFTLFWILIEKVHLQQYIGAPALTRVAAASISFLFAVSNGYYWNSRWTFQAGTQGARSRYAKFLLTNVVGLALNLGILSLVAHLVPEGIVTALISHLHDPAAFIGKLAATFVVVFWNFLASRYWTFKD